MKEPAVLHVDPERQWGGGQQQALYLHLGMLSRGLKSGFICNPGSELANRLKQHNAHYHCIRHRFEADILAGIQLALYARAHAYHILHLHSSHALSWGLLAKLFYPSLKLIASRRVDLHIGQNFLSRWKYTGPMVNAMVAISDKVRQVMLQDGVPQGRIRLIYSGVDTQKFDHVSPDPDYRKHWQIPEETIIIGTVAAFVSPKDYRNFFGAAAIALKSNPRLHFVAVGDGRQMATMKELVAELGIADKVCFSGFQSCVGSHLKAFDIFVIASKKEGLGTSVLDAMSVGLPVIGTRAGGIAEMIEDGSSGLLVEVRNSEALAQAIVKLAADKELRQHLSSHALKRVHDFSKEKMVDANIRLYKSL
ncbi:MAG: glycosyltransferase [Candidatus Cloacimonetes bacterium]|nr:glycosyltransferase [Candidatus Cloacimonadota bacterium]MCK9242824.1 glycosyltransferase [Candidatus Cloacimonadota bacterium]